MKLWVAVVLGALLLAPVGASAQVVRGPGSDPQYAQINAHPAECSRLRRQIDHFSYMFLQAKQRNNDMWMGRLANQIELLRGMQAARCPSDVPVDEMGEAFKQLMILAAKGAITYFTFGAGGF